MNKEVLELSRKTAVKVYKYLMFVPILALLSCASEDNGISVTEPYSTSDYYMGTGEAGPGQLGLNPLETQLYLPHDLAFGPDGNAYVADWNNHRILVAEPSGVRKLIGTGELGDAQDGIATETGLNHPTNVSFDPQGYLILAAWHNSKVMRFHAETGRIESICGDGSRKYGGDGGPANAAYLDLPSATAFDSNGRMFISDQGNNRVRVVDSDNIINTYAGNGSIGSSGDGGPAIDAKIFTGGGGQAAFPSGKIALDSKDRLFICDTGNSILRMVDDQGIISTVAGTGDWGYSGDSISAETATLYWPADVAVDSQDNIYIADTFNHCIRKVDRNGIITTVAGKCGEQGDEILGSKPTDIKLDRPYGISFDLDDNLYIADTHNHRILVVYK